MALPNIIQQINSKLPLTGGTITGRLNVTNINGRSAAGLHLYSGDNNAHGANIQLFRNDHTQYAGKFYIRASLKSSWDDTELQSCDLIGHPNGTLTWNGNNVITSAGGTINGTLVLTKGTNLGNIGSISIANGDWVYPALLSNTSSGFYAISGNSPKQAGEFICRANKDGSNFVDLCGRTDGILTWGGKNVVCVTNWASGIHGYRKYSDGLIEQWGLATASHGGVINLHTSFASTNYCVYMLCENVDSHWMFAAYSRTTTSFYTYVYWSTNHGTGSVPAYWFARGY